MKKLAIGLIIGVGLGTRFAALAGGGAEGQPSELRQWLFMKAFDKANVRLAELGIATRRRPTARPSTHVRLAPSRVRR